MKDFRDLNVWERAHQFVLAIYKTTKRFPQDELYGVTGQIRRAAASIPTNISEGCGRASDSDFARFLQIAFGSSCEAEYLLLLSHDLGYLDASEHKKRGEELTEVKKMLSALIQKLRGNR
jgi:four helix bundle protein